VFIFIFFRTSSVSLGFREPTPPGKAPDASDKKSMLTKTRLTHPLANESSWSVVVIFFRMRRTWALLTAFSTMCLLRQGSSFASIYAKEKLGVPGSVASSLFTTYNIASGCAGFFGGFVYDVVPGGKFGIGCFMTALNVLSLLGFLFALSLEMSDSVSLGKLHIFMGIIGFAGVLPTSLPFQVFSMGVGGVKHCAVVVAIFEFVAHFVEAGIDLLTGELLEAENFAAWLGLQCGFAIIGTITMAWFYYIDWKRAPNASSLIAAPDLNTKDKKSIARSMKFAAQQAQTKEEAEKFNKELFASKLAAASGGGSSSNITPGSPA